MNEFNSEFDEEIEQELAKLELEEKEEEVPV